MPSNVISQRRAQLVGAVTASVTVTPSLRVVTRSVLAPVVSATQAARPSADISIGGWTTQAGGTTNLFSTIDEVTASAADYIQGSLSPAVADEVKLRLSPLTDPASSAGHVARYHYQKNATGGDRIDLTVNLYRANGTTLIAGQTHADIDTLTAGQFVLSGAEADSIPSGDYATGLVVGFSEIAV